jgi:ubiquinone/menaquinone biosynthesis C-methylase UbiE
MSNRPPQKTDWSNVADWYDDLVGLEGSDYHRHVVLPGTLRLLGDPKGKSVLDLACGQGVLCRQLQQLGATVTGIDGAGPLIAAAKGHGPADIKYLVGDARELEKLKPLAGQQFDAVTCLLAIQNIHPIHPVFQSVATLLKPGGVVIVVMMHPAFRGPKETHWQWTDDQQVQYRRVDRYLLPRKSPITTNPGKRDGRYTWTFHKPIEAYVKSMVKAGLLLSGLEEWPSHKQSQPGPRAAAENTAREEIPMFLALRGAKLALP